MVDSDPDARSRCEELCNAYLCCVSVRAPCEDSLQCHRYGACQAVWDKTEGNTVTQLPQALIPDIVITRAPTKPDTPSPTVRFTGRPTGRPTKRPTKRPTVRPTVRPSQTLSAQPTLDFVSTACSYTALATDDGFEYCEEICEVAMCCMGLYSSCASTQTDFCASYEPCFTLWSFSGSSDSVDERIQNPGPTQAMTPGVFCTEENLEEEVGRKACQSICERFGCCVLADNDCRNDFPEACDTYGLCKRIG